MLQLQDPIQTIREIPIREKPNIQMRLDYTIIQIPGFHKPALTNRE